MYANGPMDHRSVYLIIESIMKSIEILTSFKLFNFNHNPSIPKHTRLTTVHYQFGYS